MRPAPVAQYGVVDAWSLAQIRDYYERHAELLAPQLIGREVRRFPPHAQNGAIDSVADLRLATAAGAGGFSIAPHLPGTNPNTVDRLIITLTIGDGADIATAATVCLGISERLSADGLVPIAATDGVGGLIMYVPVGVITTAEAQNYVRALIEAFAAFAPEIATIEPERSDGRMLLSGTATDPAVFSWAPYSLVPGAEPGVVTPLDFDDVAAASAGMPLDLGPLDIEDRIQLRGDLARALHRGESGSQ